MEFDINKDPQELNKSAFEGRKKWQYVCIAAAVLIAVITTLVLAPIIGDTANSLICAFLVVPLGYIGLFKKNGLDFFEYYSKKRRNLTGSNCFYYINEVEDTKKAEEQKNKQFSFKKKTEEKAGRQ